MTSVLVLRQPQSQSRPQILLLRRSPTDSYPLKWEAPGGSVDASDTSVLAAAARELWEETRLSGARFHAPVGATRQMNRAEASRVGNWGIRPEDEDAKDVEVRAGDVRVPVTTFLETGEVWGKLNFLATAEGDLDVVTDPEEHVDWGWFTEDEVRRGRALVSSPDGAGADEDEEKVLEFTSQAVWGSILEGFRLGRELGVIV